MQNELEKQVNFLVYSTPEQDVKVNAVLKDESIWLIQKAMAELFSVNAISKHLSNIFEEEELNPSSTVSILEIVQKEGARNVKHS